MGRAARMPPGPCLWLEGRGYRRTRWPRPGWPLLSQVALKLPPFSEEIVSSWVPFLETMVISVGLRLLSCDPSTADPLKFTVPKSASGRTPVNDDGASTITSADAREAPLSRPAPDHDRVGLAERRQIDVDREARR